MMTIDCPLRLAVVAAIIDGDNAGDGPLATAARLGSENHKKAEAAAIAAATPAERALAQALQDDNQRGQPSVDHTIAELLLIADDGPAADELAARLSQAFLPQADSRPALARDERCSAFADVYRRLALHQLNSQVRNKAAAVLSRLGRPHRHTARSQVLSGGHP
jgi:hypothetical protein